jgi:UDP-2,3-diacylglucosamine hydrolase
MVDKGNSRSLFLPANHDVWMFDSFPKELGVEASHKTHNKGIFWSQSSYLPPADLALGDPGYKLLKEYSRALHFNGCSRNLHPNSFGYGLATSGSVSSRYSKEITHVFRAKMNSKQNFRGITLEKEHFDFFIYGHWHSPVIHFLSDKSKLVVLGDWLVSNTYAVWDGETFKLMRYKQNETDEVIDSLKL